MSIKKYITVAVTPATRLKLEEVRFRYNTGTISKAVTVAAELAIRNTLNK